MLKRFIMSVIKSTWEVLYKTKWKNFCFFVDSFVDWQQTVLKLCWFAWSDFITVYVTFFVSQLVIGQFDCSVLPPSDIKRMLSIESDCKNISTWYNFLNSGLNHTKLSNCNDTCKVTLCLKSEGKSKKL